MAIRSVPWQRVASDAVSWHQDQAQSATIYILREMGPTGFLLKEEGETKKFKVFLGDPHKCTCSVFMKEKDLCKHICWVLLKKFRLDRNNELTFQRGLVEREINEVLRGLAKREDPRRRAAAARIARNAAKGQTSYTHTDGREALEQREITEDDVCPICQDEMLGSREPVTYCRFGCAKSIHIKCMKVWADHQKSTGEMVLKCPLCREDFGQIDTVEAEYRNAALQKTRAERADIHMGIACSACNQSPISGKCYKCSECTDYYLCQKCFSSTHHTQHTFQFRQKSNQRWRPAQRGSGGALPSAVMSDLQNRDITEDDYDTLLQLDNPVSDEVSTVPDHVVKSFKVETVREGSNLLSLGTQCRVCLRGYALAQLVKTLPCKHKFHAACIDQWLLHEHPTCPVDGTVVWNPLTGQSRQTKKKKKVSQETEQHVLVPGLGSVKLLGRSKTGVTGGDVVGLMADFQLTGASISSKQTAPHRSTPDRIRGVPQQPLNGAPYNGLHRLSENTDTTTPTSSSSSHGTQHVNLDFNELTNHKPPTGGGRGAVRHRPPARPTALDRNRTHIASIPLPREAAMTPIGGRSGSSVSGPMLASEVGSPTGSVRERGRERGRLARRAAQGSDRRVRSCSNSRRSSSRDRLSNQQQTKPQSAENMFLGPASGQLLGSSSKPSSTTVSGHPRSKVKPALDNRPLGPNREMVDFALSGNGLNPLHLNGLERLHLDDFPD